MHMKKAMILVLLLAVCSANLEARLKFFEYCSYLNYPVQDHIIHTDDGYNLQFYRIQAKNSKIVSGKKVVYLQHGLVDSSDTWVVNDEELAPGFYLANLGYDVWVGNSRGNRYSHPHLSPKVKEFWNFTFDDMARHDLPAAFLYINQLTARKIHYIGHSQGTMIMFIALAEHYKGVQENLASFSAFGPVAYLKHQKSKIMSALSKTDIPEELKSSGVLNLLMLNHQDMMLSGQICLVSPAICKGLLKQISEENNTVNNIKRLPVIMSHFPSGSSTKNIIHYAQYIRHEVFNKFDYGERLNLKVYGQKTAPVYKLENIKFPVHLYVGKYDKLADETDCDRLMKQLTNSVGKSIKLYDFGHATFIWGKSLVHMEDAVKVIESSIGDTEISRNDLLDNWNQEDQVAANM